MAEPYLHREFHVSRVARDRYRFDETLFALNGNVVLANFRAARQFAQKMNARRDLALHPERTVRAGQLNAMGLIDEVLHLVVKHYQEQRNPAAIRRAVDWLDAHLGEEGVQAALASFAEQFPPIDVYRGRLSLNDYLQGQTTGTPNREIVLEEMLMLWLANVNPAFSPFGELFDDAELEKTTIYLHIAAELHRFFDTQPRFGPDHENLIDMLRAPARASPDSLAGQLRFILTRWSALLGEHLTRLLSSLDFIKEEERMAAFVGIGGPPNVPVPTFCYAGVEFEPERFSPDLDWMPNLVLIAKNAYVWLDQLSKKHQRAITRLDQIPDDELDQLARWGFTGLWLIGVWQRSQASRRIKQMMGNPDAVASAYSLFEYGLADALGGDAALQDLKARAASRGIRLASDMVPNHMGIDSRWVIEHPDWFISLDYSPFPSYTFDGPDLSWDSRVGVFLEDHYYTHTDAAVVFKRLDRWTGAAQFIYHGNDGTSMPWNDTAQLNYVKPDVREAVIQTILHVARQFPIIRFDAAMTLAKKHLQRLWFPEPGTGGAIPSRAEFGMTREQLDALVPQEFWREVVDRVALEAPDTLLLAEAFWLMEGYFVRTLGMHRVYNSAFMNMLRDEKNSEYRQVMKNTLEFDPEILKRYVNFMNNPDEKTAVEQFGKGDKYFGIATLMATLPGLPMFGHGQIEGYAEKYGMEYPRAYWDEQPDPGLIATHDSAIFPLLRRRYLFAGVGDFLLYDLYTDGRVNEDVFVYSNRAGGERALVAYHNKFGTARGWIRTSAAYAVKNGAGADKRLAQKSLGEGLGLTPDPKCFCIFRDQVSGLEFLRNSGDLCERGLYLELNAYERNVFLDWREVRDDGGLYARLVASLNGRGVPSVDGALRELALQPVLAPFREVANAGWFRWALDRRVGSPKDEVDPEVLDQAERKMLALLNGAKGFAGGTGDPAAVAAQVRRQLHALLQLPVVGARFSSRSKSNDAALAYIAASFGPSDAAQADISFWGTLLGWVCVRSLGQVVGPGDRHEQSRAWMDEWMLGSVIGETLRSLGLDEPAAWSAVTAVQVLLEHPQVLAALKVVVKG
ncbi:MAG: alpha-amylase family glycosyl hydrolase, partial [Chloroflexi bacterium]|nr:alpha-amylase family glycosyl hydrolase [Chloroflexota bacterium]